LVGAAAMALLLSFAGACGDNDSGGSSGTPPVAPTVMSSFPANVATDVPVNGSASATFSEAMNSASLNGATVTLTNGNPAVSISGTVIYADSTVTFWPSEHLADNTTYTATITTGATSAPGVALAVNHVWSFTTGVTVAPGVGVNLGAAGNFAILAKSGISTVPASVITGDIGVSPAAATFITGFSLTADASNVFSTSPQVTGNVYAADYAPPTPSNMTTSVSDMLLAFTDASGRAPDVTELGAGDIGGMTLAPGVYKWSSGLLIPTSITLDGSATDVWILQVAQDLIVGNAVNIVLAGGAQAQNIYWQVAGFVDVGTTAHAEGIFLCQTSITLQTGASINGRLLAQTAVVLDQNTVTQP
jgi:hypothetical protein